MAPLNAPALVSSPHHRLPQSTSTLARRRSIETMGPARRHCDSIMNALTAPGTRRAFLKQSAIAGAAMAFPAVLRAANLNSRVNVAAIGVDGQGFSDLHNVASHPKAKFVGFCDVDTTRFAQADAAVPGVPHFQDFRVMLDQLGDTVDAVMVAIPDHMHARVTIEALKRTKHVYCEKPLAHNVWEARQVRLWAEKKGVVTQMGNQIHSAVE